MDTNLPPDVTQAPDRDWSGAACTAADAAGIIRLPSGLAAILLPLYAGAGTGPVTLLIGGVALPAPTATLRLEEGVGGRQVIIVRMHGTALAADDGAMPSIVIQRHGGTPATFIASPPDGPRKLPHLFGALSAPGRARLLHFLVGAFAGVFRLGSDHRLASLLLQVAHGLARGGSAGVLKPLTAPVGEGLSLWEVPGEITPGPWYLLSAAGIRRIAPPAVGLLILEDALPDRTKALLLPPPDRKGRHRAPMIFDRCRANLPGVLASGGSQGDRTLVAALLRRHAAEPTNEHVARLLRDRRLLTPLVSTQSLDSPVRPVGGALEIAVSDAGGGVFIGGWLRDPFGMVTGGLVLRDPSTGVARPVPPESLEWLPRPDLDDRFAKAVHGGAGARPGFIAYLPDLERATGGPVTQWGLELRLGSGEAIALTAPPSLLPPVAARDLVLRSVHPSVLRPGLLDRCIIPAVARLQRAALGAIGAAEVVEVGRVTGRPRVAVVIPLYRNLRFLRFQIAAFAQDGGFCTDAQLIFVLDSPEQRAELEQMLRGLHGIYGLPVTMVVMPVNAGYASACNAGARAAAGSAETILLLNSDVIPAARGWLRAMLRTLDRDERTLAVGPKLLFEDGSVQHAGLFFAREGAEGDWLNGHYGKGLPRRYPSVMHGREVPGVTGAALLVRRDAFEAVGGLCTEYVIGDYEDSDLCLRLRELGGIIRYVPAAELYHFERQSIVGHGGYARTLACAHNRRIHHRRWDRAIADLMAGFDTSNSGERARP